MHGCIIQDDIIHENTSLSLGFTPSVMYLPEKFKLTTESLHFMQTKTKSNEIVAIDESDEENEEEKHVKEWIEFKKHRLTMQDRQVISKGEWLVDKHISFAQTLIKDKFPTINGLKCTQYQTKQLLHLENVLQIIHIGSNHWAVISTIGCTEGTVKLYDSLYTSIGSETITIIASLFRFLTPSFTVKVMNVGRQVGFQDCGLYAISFVTSLAYEEDPTIIKYEQEEMRDHLLECFDKKELLPFPSKKRRKVLKSELKSETFKIFCSCRLPEKGQMICCDSCNEWFHQSCIETSIDNLDDDDWFCAKCSNEYLELKATMATDLTEQST